MIDDYIEIDGSLIKKTEVLAISKVVRSGAAYIFQVKYFDTVKILSSEPTLEACEDKRSDFIKKMFTNKKQ